MDGEEVRDVGSPAFGRAIVVVDRLLRTLDLGVMVAVLIFAKNEVDEVNHCVAISFKVLLCRGWLRLTVAYCNGDGISSNFLVQKVSQSLRYRVAIRVRSVRIHIAAQNFSHLCRL